MILAIINSTILLSLSLLHFYWAFGGQWGFTAALPTNKEGKRLLNPKWQHSLIVGAGLLVFAVYLLVYTDYISLHLPDWMLDSGIWIITVIFLMRAIGDFKYIGFFKKVKGTDFAIGDSKYFSLLCLWLALSSLCLILLR